ncbi:hypothetical protein BDZ89DRAFT_1070416 [Hymenopellis radicata]|nr:hypothetical protein BDZ89DRAFT_1070416 [Hymenopellis radicata]
MPVERNILIGTSWYHSSLLNQQSRSHRARRAHGEGRRGSTPVKMSQVPIRRALARQMQPGSTLQEVVAPGVSWLALGRLEYDKRHRRPTLGVCVCVCVCFVACREPRRYYSPVTN